MHSEESELLFENSSRASIPIAIRNYILCFFMLFFILVQNKILNLALGILFSSLMMFERTSFLRWTILGVFTFNILLIFILGTLLLSDSSILHLQLSKTFAGLTLLNWYGSGVSWPEFKRKFLRLRVFKELALFIDRGIFQGQVILDCLRKRFQAAFLRTGKKYRRPANVSRAIAGGIASSLERAYHIEDALFVRNSPGASDSEQLSIKNCSVSFKDRGEVLKDISLDLFCGEWLFVTGPSGSGKTTLLKLIAGLLKPKTGSIAPESIRAGFIFQNPDDQFFATTPMEDVLWGLTEHGIAREKAEEMAKYWLREMGIAHLAHQPLARLSFGEKKRVAFAGTLALEPSLLLCDEPTAGLDYITAKKLLESLETIAKKRSLSVIWVSHDLEHLPSKSTRAMLLKDGQTVFLGAKNEALKLENLRLAGLR